MFRFFIVALSGLVCVPPALAQDASGPPPPVRITITKADCSRLVHHQPADDVTYRPGGESVRGHPVAPADLPGSGANAIPNLLPDVLEFPLNIKPLQGKAYATHGTDDTTSTLGVVRYDMLKGTFTFNGEPLGDPDLRALSEACSKQGVR